VTNSRAEAGGPRAGHKETRVNDRSPKTQLRIPALFLLCVVLLVPVAAFGQARPAAQGADTQLEYTKAHYTKFDYAIPMRDGVKLFTSVYVPKDKSRTYPILLERTPYSIAPYGVDNYRSVVGPSELCEKEGFIVAYQDVRGRNKSEGEFVDIPFHKDKFSGPTDTDESTDTYDTVEWLVRNIPGNNGKVGMWGISYPGFYAAFGLIDAHPALKAISPQAPMADEAGGDDAYHNGALFLAANYGFYSMFVPRKGGPEVPSMSGGRPRRSPDQYDFFLKMGPLRNAKKTMQEPNPYWDDLIAHSSYDDFWRKRALIYRMKGIKPAVLVVGGWFDAEDLGGTPKLYQALLQDRPDGPIALVMGPWTHGGWAGAGSDRVGNVSFGAPTGEFFREAIELPFFLYYLKGEGRGPRSPKDGRTPRAWIFETGTNEWRCFETWPPKEARKEAIYLAPGGKLVFAPAPAEGPGYDEYLSDPAKPVPVIGRIGAGMPRDYMTDDQRFAAQRPDVLVYVSEPLERDLTIAGPVTPSLRVSTSGTDSDFDVKLIDVYPDDFPEPAAGPGAGRSGVIMAGYQQLVRGEPFRGKFRNSFSKPEPFTPDKPEKLAFAMPDVCHTFRRGHRIMVQVQSSWFPLTDRNPQKFVDIAKASEADFQKAFERVYRGGPDGSRLEVLVLD
jgi:putative CocE/NonD family hydrolase